jgi:DNA-binding protein H-NS
VNQFSFESMSLDDLWTMREEIVEILVSKMNDEKMKLERRLAELRFGPVRELIGENRPERRLYPKVKPKYRNPQRPFETWSGRGRQPRWVSDLLQSGTEMDDLRIASA